MKRILIIGNGPLPNDNTKKRPSEGLRTWQFLKSLMGGRVGRALQPKDGLNVRLVTLAMPDCYDERNLADLGGSLRKDFDYGKGGADSGTSGHGESGGNGGHESGGSSRGGFIHHQIPENDPVLMKTLQAICDEFVPDIVVGVNPMPAYLASGLKFEGLFWADMNGWGPAKAQTEAHKLSDDSVVREYLKMEESVLKRADMLSVVSEAQKYALLGELALFRRLDGGSFEKEIVYTIENGMEDFDTDKIEKIVNMVKKGPSLENAWSAGTFEQVEGEGVRYFRGEGSFSGANIPHNAFVMLWLGGFSAWVDEDTLFKGVEAAMEEADRQEGGEARRKIYFVSTGGLVGGGGPGLFGPFGGETTNKTFLRFKEMVELSRFSDRFIFLGWVLGKHLPYVYQEADASLNIDRKCLETMTGSRNRLNEMMKFYMPIITTLNTELSYQMHAAGACSGVRASGGFGSTDSDGGGEALKEAILELYHNPARRKDYSDKARKFFDTYSSYARVMRPFVKWVDETSVGVDDGGGVWGGGGGGGGRTGASGKFGGRKAGGIGHSVEAVGTAAIDFAKKTASEFLRKMKK